MADLKANFFEGDGDGVQDGALQGAEPERTEAGEGTESDLFAELGGPDANDGDEDAELFADDSEASDEGDDRGATAQLQRLRRQRTDLRSENQRLQEQIRSISDQLEASREMASVITKRYAKYDNPAAMVSFDADFMEAMESLKDQIPEIPKVAEAVRSKMEGKSLFATDTPEAKPAEDPRVAKLLEAHARDRVTSILTDLKIKPTLQRTVAKEIMARLESKEDITRTDVLRSLQGAMETEGWTEADIRSVAPKKKAAPDVGKPRQAVTPGGSDEEASDEGRKVAKTKSEWDANREGLFRSFEQSLQ